MSKLSKGDYIIASSEQGKFQFLKVRSASADVIKAVVEQSQVENKRVSIEIKPEEVVLNMGRRPKFGRVYGQLIEPLRAIKTFDDWGELHYYRKLDKEEKRVLRKALDFVMQEFRRRKLTFIFPITVELRNKAGRWSGFYKSSPKIDNMHNHLTVLGPKEYQYESLVHLIRHELGHAVWFKGVTNKMRLRWIKLYTHYMKLNTAKLEKIKAIRKALENTRSLDDYRSQLKDEEDDKTLDVLDECVDYVRSTFNLDADEVEILIDSGESLVEYWPKHPFDSADPQGEGVMSEYGMTNPREFFAEAFRLYLEGKAGKRLTKLMDKTLSRLSK